MSNSRKTLLVSGATGKQGGAVIENILASSQGASFNILAITRDITSSKAQKLASLPNVSIIEGDMSNPETIFKKIGPVWGVYSVQVNSNLEEHQGKAMIDAAVLNGAQHFVYSSGDRGGTEISPKNPTNVKNFAAKYAIEKHLEYRAQKSPQNMTYTILRPVTFFENLTKDIHGKGFARMWEQLGNKPLQMVSTEDIGWFAAQSFLQPEKFLNASLTLVGDELTQPEADTIFKDLTGNTMVLAPCPIASAVKFVLRDSVGDMFKWFEMEGYGGDVQECLKIKPDMQDFRAWIHQNKESFVA